LHDGRRGSRSSLAATANASPRDLRILGEVFAQSARDLLGAVSQPQASQNFGEQGWVVVKPARLRAFEVGVGHVFAHPGAVPRAGPPTHDLPP
jgi:hypothetical protein